MYEKQYEFTLTGLSPLIMHWDNVEWADQMELERSRIKDKDKKQFKAGDDRCPPFTWKGYTYHDGTHLAIPNDNLRSCLMKAGAKVELKGRETFKSLSQSAILFDDLFYPLAVDGKLIEIAKVEAVEGSFVEQAAAAKQLGFRLFVKRASISGSKHVRVRPLFEKWSAKGLLTVVDEQVTPDILTELWRIAGLRVGLFDWRPSAPRSPGPYGRYTTALSAM